jgi:hypothetical protein
MPMCCHFFSLAGWILELGEKPPSQEIYSKIHGKTTRPCSPPNAAQSPRRCHSPRHPMISVFHCIKPAACTNGVTYRARKFLSPPFITVLYWIPNPAGRLLVPWHPADPIARRVLPIATASSASRSSASPAHTFSRQRVQPKRSNPDQLQHRRINSLDNSAGNKCNKSPAVDTRRRITNARWLFGINS